MKIKIVLGLALGLLFFSLGQAQQPLSLKQAVGLAMAKNLQIQVAQQDLAIADKQENWGNAGFLPSLSAGGSYNSSVNNVTQELATGGDTARPQGPLEFNNAQNTVISYDVTASYVLFDGLGRLNNLQKLQLQKNLSQTQLRFTVENTLLQVFNAFFNVAQQQELLAISKEAMALSRKRYQRAQTAGELGTQNALARLSALVDLRNDSISYLNTFNQYQKSQRQLNQVLNVAVDSSYAVDTNFSPVGALNFLSLQNQALENNAALVQAEMNRSIAQKDVNIAWSQRLPEVTASGGYSFNRQENEGGFLRFTETSGWQYGLNARWNLFSSYRTQTQIETARLRVYQSKLQLEQARQQLRVDLANAWLDFENNKKILALQKRNLSVSRLNFERTRESHQLGQATNTQLREAQLNYINAKANLNRLRYNVKLAELELMRVAGVLVAEVTR
jgi:outer membrane protein TolC